MINLFYTLKLEQYQQVPYATPEDILLGYDETRGLFLDVSRLEVWDILAWKEHLIKIFHSNHIPIRDASGEFRTIVLPSFNDLFNK